jgi:hypothetical protein
LILQKINGSTPSGTVLALSVSKKTKRKGEKNENNR